MKECSKSISRRLCNPNFMRRYFCGKGLDIGGKPDPLALYVELFPLITGVHTWDLEDGDAQHLSSVEDASYGFVHSSHCLEHLHDPVEGLKNWFRVLKPGGYLVMIVPDEDLYEQGQFPSTFNCDHKWTFTIWKDSSWSNYSVNILDLLKTLGVDAAIEKIELLNSSYREALPRYDQTQTPIAECGIEVIVRKRMLEEIATKGKLPGKASVDRQLRIHLNQYRDDQKTLKNGNQSQQPFENDADL
jgi:SAM-dependent methyltransferase